MLRSRCLAGAVAAVLVSGLVSVAVAVGPSGAATPPLRVYPLGDSITYGWTPTPGSPGGYRTFLDGELTRAEVAHQFVGTSGANPSLTLTANRQTRHDGHNGYRIDQIAANLDGTAGAYDDRGGHWLTGTATRAPIHPDIVLIHLGTNDVLKRFDPTNTYDDPEPLDEADERARFVAAAADRLVGLVDKVLALRPNAVVLVATAIPADHTPITDRALDEYAEAVRGAVGAHPAAGGRVRLVESHRAFLTDGEPTPGLLSEDGVHPTAAGYARLGQLFAEAVVAAT